MGTSPSKTADISHAEKQLFVSLKMENSKVSNDLVPHVYGSSSVIGSWDSSNALALVIDSPSMWELSFVVPPNHEMLDFKFLLKPKHSDVPCFVEEGPNRLLVHGKLEGDVRNAIFRMNEDEKTVAEYKVYIKVDTVSPFDLAASWRAYQENLQPSSVRDIPDVSINSGLDAGHEHGPSASLELDLEHYLVPPPTSSKPNIIYVADRAEDPRSLKNASRSGSFGSIDDTVDHNSSQKGTETTFADHLNSFPASGITESKSVGSFSVLQNNDGQRSLFVDRGVGSSRLVKSVGASELITEIKPDCNKKESVYTLHLS